MATLDWAIVAAAAFLAGLVRGFSGFGAAMIFMPPAAAILTPSVAAPILLIVDGLLTLPLIPPAWRRCNLAEVAQVAIPGVLAAPLGVYLLVTLDAEFLRTGIALVVLALTAALASGWR